MVSLEIYHIWNIKVYFLLLLLVFLCWVIYLFVFFSPLLFFVMLINEKYSYGSFVIKYCET